MKHPYRSFLVGLSLAVGLCFAGLRWLAGQLRDSETDS